MGAGVLANPEQPRFGQSPWRFLPGASRGFVRSSQKPLTGRMSLAPTSGRFVGRLGTIQAKS
jgi:hypothetical protein